MEGTPLTGANARVSEDGQSLVIDLETQDGSQFNFSLTDLTALQLADLLLHNTIKRVQGNDQEAQG